MPDSTCGRVHVQRRRAPDDAHELVEEEDQAEGGEHLVEMIAAIEAYQRDALDDDAEQHRRRHRDDAGEHERPGRVERRRREVRAHHVQRSVREIHEVHDPEHEREPGGEQEQQDAELQAVQRLSEERGQVVTGPRRCRS